MGAAQEHVIQPAGEVIAVAETKVASALAEGAEKVQAVLNHEPPPPPQPKVFSLFK